MLLTLVDNSDEGGNGQDKRRNMSRALYEHRQGKYTAGYKTSGPHVLINRTACITLCGLAYHPSVPSSPLPPCDFDSVRTCDLVLNACELVLNVLTII